MIAVAKCVRGGTAWPKVSAGRGTWRWWSEWREEKAIGDWRLAKFDDSCLREGCLRLTPSVPCLEEAILEVHEAILHEDILHECETGARGRRFGRSFGLKVGSRSGDWRLETGERLLAGGYSRREAGQLAWN